MIIVNKNGASMTTALADSANADLHAPSGALFEKTLQGVSQTQTAQPVDAALSSSVSTSSDWQHTLAQEKLIQDQLAVASKPAFVVTNPGDVSLGNNDPVFAASAPVAAAPSAAATDPVLRNIIAWRQEQIDPMLQVRVGDTWAKQGVSDPFNEPHLISQAQEILETAQRRLAMFPGTKAPWEGDWQTALAKERAIEAQRIAVLVEGAKNSNFVAGGQA